jgi:peroxiredoxin
MHIINGMNTELVYMVRGGREPHRKFREEFKIRPRILIDEDGAIGEMLDVYEPHHKLNDDYYYYMASSVYLIDSKGAMSCYWISSGPRGRPSPETILGILALAKDNDWTY